MKGLVLAEHQHQQQPQKKPAVLGSPSAVHDSFSCLSEGWQEATGWSV